MTTPTPKPAKVKAVPINDKIEQSTNALAGFIQQQVGELKEHITTATAKPDKWTDRFLDWVKSFNHSELFWVVLAFLLAVAYSVGGAR